jgi:hypothetical protein
MTLPTSVSPAASLVIGGGTGRDGGGVLEQAPRIATHAITLVAGFNVLQGIRNPASVQSFDETIGTGTRCPDPHHTAMLRACSTVGPRRTTDLA